MNPILLLGATGRLGSCILTELLSRGYTVHVIVRNKSKLPTQPGIVVYEGDVRDEDLLRHAIQGCAAVISALNVSRLSDWPWAKLRTPPCLLSGTAEALIRACTDTPGLRVVICSAWGTSHTRNDLPGWFRWLIAHSNIGVAYQDHERQERLFEASALTNWVIVRPVGLTNGGNGKDVHVSLGNIPKPKLLVTRQSVARFMADLVGDARYTRQMPVIFQ
ncbi:NAD(P)-dependent oxidoreductase [Hufsiella ginkgonis]|uniref:NAD(P)H-binding protein n=1 Tax=Hufsiella ginkgonis TaxID=2695274 RepID=A0A7K1XUV7_9SPHI|nr:NAD(P)H-binding protein [Hufsiella ginkgonis]MXV14791.1 NAD(P)H-binding protein [Hufsiella ginkgonis]